MPRPKEYLGDAVYAEFDHDMLKLTTSDGYENTNVIFLDAAVYAALEAFVCRIDREDDNA